LCSFSSSTSTHCFYSTFSSPTFPSYSLPFFTIFSSLSIILPRPFFPPQALPPHNLFTFPLSSPALSQFPTRHLLPNVSPSFPLPRFRFSLFFLILLLFLSLFLPYRFSFVLFSPPSLASPTSILLPHLLLRPLLFIIFLSFLPSFSCVFYAPESSPLRARLLFNATALLISKTHANAPRCILFAMRSIFRPRHHCRFCGDLFCGSCSSARVILPPKFLAVGPQRTCQVPRPPTAHWLRSSALRFFSLAVTPVLLLLGVS
jgi:hypothetical protein